MQELPAELTAVMPEGMAENFYFYVEVAAAVVIALGFLISAMVNLRARHRDVGAWHVWLGALVYGAVFGCLVGFVVMPLRFLLTDGSVPPEQAGYAGLGLFAVLLVLRRGVLSRLPLLGPQIKAYRRAALRRAIEQAEEQIAKLSPKGDAA
ncbi:MAG: hypothetical protein HXY23_00545 [Parvularculaceae bacterium]|nr:hypothetical protein [Parvularculaceae bacterium]